MFFDTFFGRKNVCLSIKGNPAHDTAFK